jgi:predicted metal-dependent peptidase
MSKLPKDPTIELPEISESDKRIALESAIYSLIGQKQTSNQDENVQFYGHILQGLNISMSLEVPTAGVYYDSKVKAFKLLINPYFFCPLTLDKRKALLLHELFHITFRHVYFGTHGYDKRLLNVAMDMVINQYISNLPDNSIDVSKFTTKDGNDFPKFATTELYYDLIMEGAEANLGKRPKDAPGDSDESDLQSDTESSQGNSNGYPSEFEARVDENGDTWVKAKEFFKDKEFDQHAWDNNEGESEDLEKMEALKDLVKRTMQKTSFGHGKAPKMIEDLLISLDKAMEKLNYKQILLSTLKKSLPSKDTMKTWIRPSRRYGDLAKGNKLGLMPTIDFYIDTSGSISHVEANELLSVTNNFMTVGVDKAHVHLWADNIYLTKKIRKNFKLEESEFKVGGTDLSGVFESIKKRKPNLAVILTDGQYARPKFNYNLIKDTNVVFIITKNGYVEHCLKDIGKTVKY